ncbi:MAG: MotA/TolQ/ExbB proton channel family protein [Nitrospinae bacterium]|nr:MotA/TolQ/ExbB proton channel family protein [Nitrospinota bacterium]
MKNRFTIIIILLLSIIILSFLIGEDILAVDDHISVKGGDDVEWNILSIIKKGGPVMYPIIFCSVLALGIALERLFHLRRNNIIDPEFLSTIKKYWHKQEMDRAVGICHKYDISMSRILRAGLLRFDYGIIEIERAIEGAGQHEVSLLSSNLRILGVIASLAPMLGFLGTVTGMIRAFNVISQSGAGNPSLVASGISEALITTAAGLIVSIPTLAIYHYFRGKVDRFIFEMEEISIQLIEKLFHTKGVTEGEDGTV